MHFIELPLVNKRRPNTTTIRDLDWYDYFLVSFSGGKDSIALALCLLKKGVPAKDRIVLMHQHVDGAPGVDSPFMDWPCTESYCRAFSQATGMRLTLPVAARRLSPGDAEAERQDRPGVVRVPGRWHRHGRRRPGQGQHPPPVPPGDGGPEQAVVQPVAQDRRGGAWPSTTSHGSRASACCSCPASGGRRAPPASRYAEMEQHRTHTKTRHVDHWRMVIDWNEEQVWDIMREFGVMPHPAYRLGLGPGVLPGVHLRPGRPVGQRAADRPGPVQPHRSVRAGLRQDDPPGQERRGPGRIRARPTRTVTTRNLWPWRWAGTIRRTLALTDNWTLPPGAFKHCGGPS